MQENPFSDAVPTHMAIAATVYTKPMHELQNYTASTRSKFILTVGTYGSGKSHALERLKNDINIKEQKKLAAYTSAFATKSLRRIYEQVVTLLVGGKYEKLSGTPENKLVLESKDIPSKIVDLFYKGNTFRPVDEIKKDLTFGKTISASSDVVNFLCAIALLVDQFIILIDDIEEATSMSKAERQEFFGNLRALYDQAVRNDINMVLVLALTPEKLDMLKIDRPDLPQRVDHLLQIEKPTLKEFTDIVHKRVSVSATEILIDKDVLKAVWSQHRTIRGMLNTLRDLADESDAKGKLELTTPPEASSNAPIGKLRKPADDIILQVLEKVDGLGAPEIVKRSGKSDPWIRHRLADLVAAGVLRKEQAARNTPATYYLNREIK